MNFLVDLQAIQASLRQENAALAKQVQELQQRLNVATSTIAATAAPAPKSVEPVVAKPSATPSTQPHSASSSTKPVEHKPVVSPALAAQSTPLRVSSAAVSVPTSSSFASASSRVVPPPPPPPAHPPTVSKNNAPTSEARVTTATETVVEATNAKELAKVWSNKMVQAEQESKANPFSKGFDNNHVAHGPQKGKVKTSPDLSFHCMLYESIIIPTHRPRWIWQTSAWFIIGSTRSESSRVGGE